MKEKYIQLIRLTSGEEIIADVDLNGIDTDTIILKDAIEIFSCSASSLASLDSLSVIACL